MSESVRIICPIVSDKLTKCPKCPKKVSDVAWHDDELTTKATVDDEQQRLECEARFWLKHCKRDPRLIKAQLAQLA